ncbi:MAG: YdeI/OmpD-associated family protein [Longimicrobiales bacterium]|nr:YdeI/OmpD-associated family protein [Longimicrobiales bacterium]
MVTDRGSGNEAPRGIRVRAEVERKDPTLPPFIVIPEELLTSWDLTGTTVVEVTLEGTELGRRTLKPWPARAGWFFDLTQAHAKKASVAVGDQVLVELSPAATGPPDELAEVLESHADARRRWEELTGAQRRMLAEHVRSAKRASTRSRRARRGLGL